MNVGQTIKKIRTERGISVDELATKLGKNRATIYRYERGDIENMPLEVLEPLSKALNTTPSHLMGWEKNDEDFSSQEDISLGNFIKLFRSRNRMTLDELSSELDVSIDDLKTYEANDVPLSIDAIKLIISHCEKIISNLNKTKTTEDACNASHLTYETKHTQYIKNLHKELDGIGLMDDECEKILEYAKFLITQRKND